MNKVPKHHPERSKKIVDNWMTRGLIPPDHLCPTEEDLKRGKEVADFIRNELRISLDQALDNCAKYETFIRMKGLLDDLCNFEDALEYFERTKKLCKEKVDE